MVRLIISVISAVSAILAGSLSGVKSCLGAIFIYQAFRLRNKVYLTEIMLTVFFGIGLIILPLYSFYVTIFRNFPSETYRGYLVLTGLFDMVGVFFLSKAVRIPKKLLLLLIIPAAIFALSLGFINDLTAFYESLSLYDLYEIFLYLFISGLTFLVLIFLTGSLHLNTELNSKRQKNLIIGGLLTVVFSAMLLYYNNQSWVKFERENPGLNQVPIDLPKTG